MAIVLNVGVFAFTASVIAFNIARYNVKNQREREFIAARAFLPKTLSELCSYFRSCSLLLNRAWETVNQPQLDKSLQPNLSNSYIEIFQNCIRHAEPDVGEYLASILTRLQIHSDRMQLITEPGILTNEDNIKAYMYRLAELQSLVDQLFPFARGEKPFNSQELKLDEFNNAYKLLGTNSNLIKALQDFNPT